MIIAFPFAFGGLETDKEISLAAIFMNHARKACPDAEIVQMSDKETSRISGTDSCYRLDVKPYGVWHFEVTANFPAEQFVRLDYDTIVRSDIEEVFSIDFDIAIAKERTTTMNNGVVFVKNRDFFVEGLANYKTTTMDNWQDIQRAMQMTIEGGKFKVERLDGDVYNFFPSKDRSLSMEELYPESAKVIHFKGSRKTFMKLDFA